MARVLVAEDDPDIQQLVMYKLGRSGFETMAVADGAAALAAVRRFRPDAVLVDVRMPGINGIELCRELRRTPVTAKLPIVMISAQGRPQDRELAYAAGCDDYLVKPFSPRDLVERVQKLLVEVRA
ncbi:two-component system phosphate regulon response regulator PhoB [Catenuloplanes nepalensis]|uniref:Two-component system phosphate regulon response regulator PhoB n=1 Tax=Catenuloplanes nepalensis TaxID=587533 RepID=A0ABT9MLK7_9ACTN|nr:response regulator [Catenuloplanes nepalensis]MDP9792297.1 two-component system phosphate regulon response regulator PhoB [Catenuloplanes nepalensis]